MKKTYLDEKNNRLTATKNVAFFVMTFALILISVFFISSTVYSQAHAKICTDEKYYQMLEKEYVSEIRDYLNEQGFENSGVTLTRVVDEQGYRDYSVALHHKYLEKLSVEEREALFKTIENLAFQAEGCIFRINLLL